MRTLVTHERLLGLLNYDPASGEFQWKRKGRGVRSDCIAGTRHSKDSYWQIRIDGANYYSHRLAWFYVFGQWPKNQIDHSNRDRSDNRIANLREATQSQNMANQPHNKRNKRGLKGVYLNKYGKWQATIQHDGKSTYLGVFATPEEAASAYQDAAIVMFGEFAPSSPTCPDNKNGYSNADKG